VGDSLREWTRRPECSNLSSAKKLAEAEWRFQTNPGSPLKKEDEFRAESLENQHKKGRCEVPVSCFNTRIACGLPHFGPVFRADCNVHIGQALGRDFRPAPTNRH
jgi:hypothetical protein